MKNETIMPKTIYPSKEELEKLGFIFFESDNEDLYNVILPENWTVEEDVYFKSRGTDMDKSWNIYDEYDNLRGDSCYLPTLNYLNSYVSLKTFYFINTFIERGVYEVVFMNRNGEIIYHSEMGDKEDYEKLKKEVELFAETNYKDWRNIQAYWPKTKKKRSSNIRY